MNANQVFKWRREFERGEWSEPVSASASLLPVVLSGGDKPQTSSGCIHIELQGRALISIESGADPALLRTILGVPAQVIELRVLERKICGLPPASQTCAEGLMV